MPKSHPARVRRGRRRWLLVPAGALALLLVAVAGVYGWAYASTDSSTIARAL